MYKSLHNSYLCNIRHQCLVRNNSLACPRRCRNGVQQLGYNDCTSILPSVCGRYFKSTTASSKNTPETLDLTFSDSKQAFKSKTNWEVIRAYVVFRLCGIDALVKHNQQLHKIGQKALGKTLFEKVMKLTFFGHFVAGTDQVSIKPNIRRLNEFGVKAILDYSAEEDISEEEASKVDTQSFASVFGQSASKDNLSRKYSMQDKASDRRQNALSRTFFYMNESQCERNMVTFLQAIDAVSATTKGTGFAAIKMTALGRPQLLLHLSEAIARAHRFMGSVTGKKGQIVEQEARVDDLLKKIDPAALQDPTVKFWLGNLTYDSSGLIHILPWQQIVDARVGLSEVLKVPDLSTGKVKDLVSPLTGKEDEMFKNMMRRLHTIFRAASELDIRVMVDAEQTYFQKAISRITMELMRQYNQERAIVFNTYQCYLTKAYDYLVADLNQAKRQDFYFGAKLVRGAYMEQERERAATLGHSDPINPTYEATTAMYHKCFEEGIKRMKAFKDAGKPERIRLMAATHNEDTVRYVIQKMNEYGIDKSERAISFGQLYGMCDQVSFPLGQAGYSVYKYVPYGPVAEVMPYLSRRAQENRGFLGKTQKEIDLLGTEIKRRFKNRQIFYRPKGNYHVF